MKLVAIGDIHVRGDGAGWHREIFRRISQEADVLVLAGDLTDSGQVSEAEVLARELEACTIPVVAVLGNHDYDLGQEVEIVNAIRRESVHVLEGDSVVIEGVGFAGVKGLGGGFGSLMLASFGESIWKDLVKEAEQDALMLDRALAKLDSDDEVSHKVVITHYAPVRETVVGEPEEIFPFLGSSRLAETIDRREVNVAFHGHAHKGTLKGKTRGGVPVFNVSRAVLLRQQSDKPWLEWELKP